MKTAYKTILFTGALALATFTWLHAIPTTASMPLTGNTDTDLWINSDLVASSNSGFPGFPGSSAWPNPIASGSGGDATLNKTANGTGGGPYPAGSSIYYGGFSGDVNNNGGELTVTDSPPLTDLMTVGFQVVIGEAWTYDFFNDVFPQLTINGVDYAPTHSSLAEQFYNGTVAMPTGDEAVYINLWAFQWDLSAWYIANPSLSIDEFSISFNGVQHAQVYAMQLDQSDASHANILPPSVPEPGAPLLVLVAGLAFWNRRRAR